MSESRTVTLVASGQQWANSKVVAEKTLGQRPGVIHVDLNPTAQTATIDYDTSVTTLQDLSEWVRKCGLHCSGASVPDHICDPLAEPETFTKGASNDV